MGGKEPVKTDLSLSEFAQDCPFSLIKEVSVDKLQ